MPLSDSPLAIVDFIDPAKLIEDAAYHTGSIDETTTSMEGGRFTGWALEKNGYKPANSFVVKSELGAVVVAPNVIRNDLARRFGPDSSMCGVLANVPLRIIGSLFAPKLKYYAHNGRGVITELNILKENDKLSMFQIQTGHDFFRTVQTPSTRLADVTVLAHLSLHALSRSRDNYVIGAAAACVLGYRLLEGLEVAKQRRETITSEIARLLEETPQLPRGLFLRWHTSLRLVAGYLAYQAGSDTEAYEHFRVIGTFGMEIKQWPQALTNILIGVVISGYLLYERGDVSQAVDRWKGAEDLLRYGASVAEFQNFYAYGELGNAVRVAQFAHVAALCAVRDGVLDDLSLAPAGTGLDMTKIPGPMGKLVTDRAVEGRSFPIFRKQV